MHATEKGISLPYLNTHPDSAKRSEMITTWLPEARQRAQDSDCSRREYQVFTIWLVKFHLNYELI